MDPIRPTHRVRWLRRLLLLPLTTEGVRLIDLVIVPIGAVVAFFVCIPILIVTTLAGGVVGYLLDGLGVPYGISGLFGLAGFVGGLALAFVVLVRLYRRLPKRIRSWVIAEDEPSVAGASALPFGRDPDADDATLHSRIANADTSLAARDAATADRPDA
jgi:hypothetical protein